jgi:16S rRNA (adenine1518-N6/adenine1519-N6)-dimethyltransferase
VSQSVQSVLRSHGLRPQKRLGQNFLASPAALERIVAAADLLPGDVVVEVGAGLGTLTRPLAERAGCVIAIELDGRLVSVLHRSLADLPSVQVVHADILQLPPSRFPDPGLAERGYKVVANLPYYITSAVLRHFLERQPRPKLMVVTVQREVAERIVAQPGDMSLLAVSVQFYGRPRIVARIPASAFYPSPEVDSAVVRIDVAQQPTVTVSDEQTFFRVVRAGFSQKRKTLRNSLRAGLGLTSLRVEQTLAETGIDLGRRAETLSLEEWASLAAALGVA